eukprot:1030935-Prymnesium_polylepis.1
MEAPPTSGAQSGAIRLKASSSLIRHADGRWSTAHAGGGGIIKPGRLGEASGHRAGGASYGTQLQLRTELCASSSCRERPTALLARGTQRYWQVGERLKHKGERQKVKARRRQSELAALVMQHRSHRAEHLWKELVADTRPAAQHEDSPRRGAGVGGVEKAMPVARRE